MLVQDFINPDFFDLFKIRGSIANVGNDTDPYQLVQTFSVPGTGYLGLTTLSAPSTRLNPNLKPDAKLIEEVNSIEEIKPYIQDIKSGLGTGGMQSKIHALEICEGKGIEVFIVNGGVQFFLRKALKNEIKFTRFKG